MDLYNQWLHHAQQPPISPVSTPDEESIDLAELTMPESQPPPPTPPSSTQPSSFFNPYQPNGFFIPPYTTLAGYTNTWPGQQQPSVPLSSYSSLNGATSASAAAQQQHQQQQLQHPTPMMIDPALLGGSASSFFTQLISPSISQGTLAPQSLHAPSPPTTVPTPTLPSTSTLPTAPSPPSEDKKRQFKTSIQPLLASSAFTGAGAVNNLIIKILEFGIDAVESSARLEILTKIRDHAGNHYFRAWSENESAMEMTKKWLVAGSAAAKDDPLKETVMPILHIIHRLPLTLDALKENKMGKMIKKLTKDPHPAIKDMASVVEQKWRQLMGPKPTSTDTEERAAKKRKLSEPPATKPTPASSASKPASGSRKPLSSSSAATRPAAVKRETKTVVTAANNSKTDSSFFSSNKPKLPSFKKAPPAPPQVKKEDQPSQPVPQINAFAVALEGLKRKGSPSVLLPNGGVNGSGSGTSTTSTTPVVEGGSLLMKLKKKRKSVTWATPDKLEMVKFIERAIYDDDLSEGGHGSHSLKDLDRSEGAALHAHLFEEQVDWIEPILIEMPEDIEPFERGAQSTEKAVQDARERTALTAVYMSAAHIPDSPAEPSTLATAVEDMADGDGGVKIMICGPELDAVFHNNDDESANNQMRVENSMGAHMTNAPVMAMPPEIDHAKLAQMLSSLTPDLLTAVSSSVPPAPILSAWGDGGVGHGGPYGGQYGLGQPAAYSVPGPSSGFRENNNGGGGYYARQRKVPCKFFLQGRCLKGDQCTFEHEFS